MDQIYLRLQDYRSFKDTGDLLIRPITFLIGENSSGKTSLMAALNYLFRMRDQNEGLRLNSPPFELGSFDQIVHTDKNNHAKDSFILSFKFNVDSSKPGGIMAFSPEKKPVRKKADDDPFVTGQLSLQFGSVFGSPEITQVQFNTGQDSVVVEFYPKRRVNVCVDGNEVARSDERELPFFNFQSATQLLNLQSLSMTIYMIRNSLDRARDSKEVSNYDFERSMRLLSAFSASLNTLPPYVFASAPIRSTPARVYSQSDVAEAPDGRSTPYRLRRSKIADTKNWKKLRDGLNEFGKISDLFSKLDVVKLTREEAGPFQIKVSVGHKRSNIADVGYGVSQALPLITELLEAPPRAVFLFQQPEVHLHPRAQAGLGSFLAAYMNNHLRSFVVLETHSDYLIDRVRTEVRRGNIPASAISILFLQRVDYDVKVHQISVDNGGRLVGVPECYRDFFIQEQASVLGVDI